MKKLYKFDSHIHTAQTSKCGRIPGAALVERYHALGYDGIAITDHLHEEYISLLYCRDDWDACVDRFLDGYRQAKARADEIGMNVILGAELRFAINDNDYLIYGIDEAFLRRNPYLYRLGPQEFFRRFGDELLIIHAHPYRGGNDVVFHDCVHGIEIINGNVRHDNHDDRALALCMANPGLYRACGSDTHRDGDENRAWMHFDAPVTTSRGFVEAVRRGGYTLGCAMEEGKALLDKEKAYFSRETGRVAL